MTLSRPNSLVNHSNIFLLEYVNENWDLEQMTMTYTKFLCNILTELCSKIWIQLEFGTGDTIPTPDSHPTF